MTHHFFLLAAALVLDRVVGDPDWMWRRYPHPVVLFGKAISFADRRLNHERERFGQRKLKGVIAITALVALSLAIGWVLHAAFRHFGVIGHVFEILIVAVLLAQKSLAEHVLRVATGLREGGLEGGRQAVSMIVGRDPKALDQSGICRGAIESLAENFSDGIVAPAFWYAVLGLPGILAYKMINTADSMIGHKNARYLAFGWGAARLDDLVNWPASRLSALLVALGAGLRFGPSAIRRGIGGALRDAGMHRSPNAGWPEAAMAWTLNVQIAGPRSYGGVVVAEPMINGAGRAALTAVDIEDGVTVFLAACTMLLALSLGLGVLFWLL
ncbi:adenosylcobinamide-phosphate synthase [Rhizobium sp. RU20A]|uniref:adenosylcobinamide-phosphate synthase CbiB n=1 Tax=Rhizobium sp. RU20A TaxID=1907412 RepID=UPI0009551E67|nr:adenosylcobinamide-phosphate synthase CbiB [Rhizobium sp. RU20A]SIQ15948.1 adenosylcobinamide-phosphate synthase [Rhizobium sp. RU20A]